ncbi:MAG TPA: plastocyanin/azurin family copper-binding protein [Candidatus Limnocylindrales bacterium]|nr:plastocyanin/azurin family copper-binding protein [Candidatus Limnocylindrales bacterium]
MRRTLTARSALAAAAMLALAACGGGASPAPSAAEPSPGEPSAAGDPCAPSTATGTVTASIIDFEFDPATVSAKVGDVISWTNDGSAPHTATLDDHSACATAQLAAGQSGAISFSAAGTYPFHCAVHPTMKGTIEISE